MISKTIALGLSSTLLLLSMSGCGSSSDDSPVATTVSGKVIGSHYEGAKVFLDLNANLEHDANEPFAISASDGSWELKNPEGNNELNVIADISVGNIVYSVNKLPLMKKVKKAVKFIAPLEATDSTGEIMISPISTMMYKKMKNDSLTFADAKRELATEVGVTQDELFESYDAVEETKSMRDLQFASEMELDELELRPVTTVVLVGASDSNSTCKKKDGIFNFLKKGVKDMEDAGEDAAVIAGTVASDEPEDPELDPKEPDEKENPDYTCQLDKMIDIETNIENNVSEIVTELQVSNTLLTDIYTQMVTDTYQTAKDELSAFINNSQTAWSNFSGNLPTLDQNQSNFDIVNSCDTMSDVKNSVVYSVDISDSSSLSSLSTSVNELLGDARQDYIEQMISSAVKLSSSSNITITQGTASSDVTAQMLKQSNEIFKLYSELTQAVQRVYNMEASNTLFLYAKQKGLMCSDSTKIPNLQPFNGVNINADLSTNMATLNKHYSAIFATLDRIIVKNANLYSDHIAQITGKNSSETGIYSPSEYAGVPQGTWNTNKDISKAGTLFTPFILVSKEYNATGYYDGATLTSVNSFDRNQTTTLDLSTCLVPASDEPSMIAWGATAENNNTSRQQLSCGWIKGENYLNSSSNYWKIKDPSYMPHYSDAPWQWSSGIDSSDKGKLIFDESFNTFFSDTGHKVSNGDSDSKDALDKDGNLKTELYDALVQTLQFTSPEGEKALFQFAITDPSLAEKRMAITCGDEKNGGIYKNADNNKFECVDVQYANQVAEKIHMKFPLTGKEYTLYLGARGKSKEIKDAPDEEYFLDYCEYGKTCPGLESYNVDYKTY